MRAAVHRIVGRLRLLAARIGYGDEIAHLVVDITAGMTQRIRHLDEVAIGIHVITGRVA